MKQRLIIFPLLCLLLLPGCSSDDTSKWQTGTKLYRTVNGKEQYFGTVIGGHGSGVTLRSPGSSITAPYTITTDRGMLARRGVYAK